MKFETIMGKAVALMAGVVLLTGAAAAAESPYAPYRFLIGEWDVGPEGGDPTVIARYRWGLNETYIEHSIAVLTPAGEVPHLEGVFMWNGVNKNLDMLIMLDLGGGRIQEQGVLRLEGEGEAVREITAVYSEGTPTASGGAIGPEGAKRRFRQTFKRIDGSRIATSLMRETPEGWVPNFPGSDKLVMVRKGT